MKLRALSLVGLSLLIAAPAAADASISMVANRESLSVGENLIVRIEVQSEGGEAPEVQVPPFDGFEVVRRQVQRPMQFSFSFGGRKQVVRHNINYTYVLKPLTAGRYMLGPARVQLKGSVLESRRIIVTVGGGAGATPQATPQPADQAQPKGEPPGSAAATSMVDGAEVDPDGFIRTVVDNGEPFEGEQVTVTEYLYVRQPLRTAPNIRKEPTTSGFWTRNLLDASRELAAHAQHVNGTLYRAYVLRRFAAFPLKSGELSIGPMTVEVQRGSPLDLFSGRRRRGPLTRTGVPVSLQVRPLPEEGRGDGDVAVGRFELQVALDRSQAVTGDAVKLTATVKGVGNVKAASIPSPVVDGLEVLQPQVRDLVEVQQDAVGGTRILEWLIVPQRAGSFSIPPLTLQTFDPASGRYRVLRSQSLSLKAAGSAVALAPSEPEAETDEADSRARQREAAIKWAPIRTHSELVRERTRLVQAPFYPWALSAGPALWLVVLLSGWLSRRRAAGREASGPQRAAQALKQRLTNASQSVRGGDATRFHAETASAVHAALEMRLGEPTAGMSHGELSRLLEARGMESKLVADVVRRLEAGDFARFSSMGSDDAALGQELAEVRALLTRVERGVPTQEDA